MADITFFYPSRVVGGAEFLIIRMARQLVIQGHQITIIDFADGFIAKELSDTAINMIPYTYEDEVPLPAGTTLILTAMIPAPINNLKLNSQIKVLVFCMDKFSFISKVPGLKILPQTSFSDIKEQLESRFPEGHQQMRRILQHHIDHQGMIFIESTSILANKLMYDLSMPEADMDAAICPTPCPESVMPKYVDLPVPVNPRHFNVGWLGRLSEEKFHCVVYMIKNLSQYMSSHPHLSTTLHVIGDGYFKESLSQIELPPNLECRWVGTLIKQELDYYLKHKVDVLFGMGTSLLESAKLKIPTVIIDSSYTPIDADYKVAWLFESHSFLLGEYSGNTRVERTHSFADILHAIYQDGQKAPFGSRCYEYFQKNHSLDVSCDRLVSQVSRCQLYADDFQANNYFALRFTPSAL